MHSSALPQEHQGFIFLSCVCFFVCFGGGNLHFAAEPSFSLLHVFADSPSRAPDREGGSLPPNGSEWAAVILLELRVSHHTVGAARQAHDTPLLHAVATRAFLLKVEGKVL